MCLPGLRAYCNKVRIGGGIIVRLQANGTAIVYVHIEGHSFLSAEAVYDRCRLFQRCGVDDRG